MASSGRWSSGQERGAKKGAASGGAPEPRDDEGDSDSDAKESGVDDEALVGEDVGAEGEAPAFEALLHPLLDAYEERLELEVPDHPPSGEGSNPDEILPPLPAPPSPPREDPNLPRARREGVAGRKRARVGEQTTVELDGGTITYFHSNGNFEAKCVRHLPDRCTFTKKSGVGAASSSSARPANENRPLGLLAAWLDVGHMWFDKEEHKGRDFVRDLARPSQREYRLERRRALALVPGAEALFEREGGAGAADMGGDEPELVR